jgi:hypothetical protein
MYNVTLTHLLREETIAAQKNDEDMAHLKRRMLEVDPKVNSFRENAKGTLWFKDRLVVLKREAPDSQVSLSPTDGWPNTVSEPDFGRYAQSMRDGTSR